MNVELKDSLESLHRSKSLSDVRDPDARSGLIPHGPSANANAKAEIDKRIANFDIFSNGLYKSLRELRAND